MTLEAFDDDLDKTLVPAPPAKHATATAASVKTADTDEQKLAKTMEMPRFSANPGSSSSSEGNTAALRNPTTDAESKTVDPVAAYNAFAAEKKEEEFRLGQSHVLQMVAANKPLSEVLKRLVLLIEAQSPDMLCSILLLSEDGDHVRHGAAPSLPEEYVKAIDGAPIGPKNGSCGTAMYRGEAIIVSDIQTDPLWEDYRDLAEASGLRACWSTPILSGRGKVLGSFAMYYHEPRKPTGSEACLTEVATRIAGLAIEHNAAREILQRTQAELAQASVAATSGRAALSIADEVNEQLEAIVSNADRCLELLDEDKPEIANFREPLKNIARHGRKARQVIARIRPKG
jgi:signal transduction protein with GAF and PtsI domain